MKAFTPMIRWHPNALDDYRNASLFSLDMAEIKEGTLIATAAGATADVKIWRSELTSEGPQLTYLSTLRGHSGAVNVVRFSPVCEGAPLTLASAGDDNCIYLWQQLLDRDEEHKVVGEDADDVEFKDLQTWKMIKILRGHVADVYDLDWSPQGGYIVSGSIDKSLIIWDVARGCKLQSFQHEKWVQGVSWDPLGEFIFSLSCDRTCQILKKKPRNKRSAGRTPCSTQISFQKFDSFKKLALQSGQGDYQLSVTLMDDNIPCYFRRLSWSPDGEFVLVSSVVIEEFDSKEIDAVKGKKETYGALLYRRENLKEPYKVLSGFETPVVSSHFNPCYSDSTKSPRKWLFALSTTNQVFIYDTEQNHPVSIVCGLHCAQITDVRWSQNGQFLASASTDGYCSFVYLEEEFLSQLKTYQKAIVETKNQTLVLDAPLIEMLSKNLFSAGSQEKIHEPPVQKSKSRRVVAPIVLSPVRPANNDSPSHSPSSQVCPAKLKRGILALTEQVIQVD